MRLRNKKTGEIHEITEVVPLHDMVKKFVIYSKTEGHNHAYKNLAELNEEWEDYEEPKDFWYIDVECGVMCDSTNPDLQDKRYPMEFMKAIGNYFETREEAEKAVEKLKAWKRLKDKGFSFEGYDDGYKHDFNSGHIEFYVENDGGVLKDLDLLFGGEE